jgi:hypothetical protein
MRLHLPWSQLLAFLLCPFPKSDEEAAVDMLIRQAVLGSVSGTDGHRAGDSQAYVHLGRLHEPGKEACVLPSFFPLFGFRSHRQRRGQVRPVPECVQHDINNCPS